MRLSIFAAALGLMPVVVSANELLEVYHQAARHDTQFAAAGFARDAALENRPQARAALLPFIAGSYGVNRGRSKGSSSQESSSDVDTDGDGVTDSEVPFAFNRDFDTDDTSHSLDVSLSQPVFNWQAFLRYSQSANAVALAQASFRSAEQQLLLRAASAYFDVLAASDNLRYAQSQKSSLERQLAQAKKRFEVGLSATTDVQESQARDDLSQADVIGAEQALAAAREALIEVTGQNPDRLVPLRDEIPLPGPQPENVEAWLTTAHDNNYDLAIARINAGLAAKDVDIARAGHYPSINLVAAYTDNDSKQEERKAAFGDADSDSRGGSVGLKVDLPIFSGGLISSQTRQAQSLAQQRAAELDGSGRSVVRQTRDAYLGVLSGASRVRALKQAVSSNQLALDASQTGLEVGIRTTVDVLNAQSLLSSAQRDYARTRYDYLLSVLKLKAAAGRLTEADLVEIDRLLVDG